MILVVIRFQSDPKRSRFDKGLRFWKSLEFWVFHMGASYSEVDREIGESLGKPREVEILEQKANKKTSIQLLITGSKKKNR